MSYQLDSKLSSADRHYRILMERALLARDLDDLPRFQQLMNEAEVLLRHIRQSSHPQREVPNAQRAPH